MVSKRNSTWFWCIDSVITKGRKIENFENCRFDSFCYCSPFSAPCWLYGLKSAVKVHLDCSQLIEKGHTFVGASHGVEISFQLNVSSLKMRPICHLNLSVVFVDLKRRERISFQLFSFGSGKLNLFILMRSVFFYPGTNNFE